MTKKENISFQKYSQPSAYDLPTKLMIFRNAYLQFIAESWNDETILSGVLNYPWESQDNSVPLWQSGVTETLLDVNDRLNTLEMESGNFSGKETFWVETRGQDVSILTEATGMLDNEHFQKFLPSKEFNFNWFAEFYLINTGKTIYNPYVIDSNNGWVGTNDFFVLKIPNRPRNPKDFPLALTSYYTYFNSVLGPIQGGGDTSSFIKKGVFLNEIQQYFVKFKVKDHSYSAVKEMNHILSLGQGGADQFQTFAGAYMDIISRAWADEDFEQYLVKDFLLTPIGTPQSVYRDEFISYANPWSFSIRFNKAEASNWDTNKKIWTGLEFNEVFLCYPRVDPNLGKPHFATAISRYNQTGPSYPFTCT